MVILAICPTVFASGKKEVKASVTFHIETEATDNPKMIFPQLANGKQRFFRRLPEFATKDIFSFNPFPSEIGADYGIVIKLKRYPWICHGDAATAVSWEISFSATGLPVAFSPSSRPVATATVTSIRPSSVPHRYLTRGLISGEGNQATLSNSGKQLVSLLTDDLSPTP